MDYKELAIQKFHRLFEMKEVKVDVSGRRKDVRIVATDKATGTRLVVRRGVDSSQPMDRR